MPTPKTVEDLEALWRRAGMPEPLPAHLRAAEWLRHNGAVTLVLLILAVCTYELGRIAAAVEQTAAILAVNRPEVPRDDR